MLQWWNDLGLLRQIFALIAIPSTVLLLLQTILMLAGLGHPVGADSDADADADADGDVDADGDGIPDSAQAAEGADVDSGDSGLAVFSIRGILSMLCIGGWTGVALLGTSLPEWASVAIAAAAGIATLFLIALVMKSMKRLQSNGNIDVGNCIGKVAQVYIPVPASGKGTGKVTLTVQEQYSEFTAVTSSESKLDTGSFVRIISVNEAGILLVEPLSK